MNVHHPSRWRRVPRPRARWAWAMALALAIGLVSLRPPLVATAAPGDSPGEAIVIGSDGRFLGAVKPQSAQWFRFTYHGGTQIAIVLAYQPTSASGIRFDLYTGDVSNPRAENLSPVLRDNTLSLTWSDPTSRDVLLQVVNVGPVSSIGFAGSIQPSSAINGPAPTPTSSATPDAESGASSQTATTVGADGAFSGSLVPRQARWYRFWYVNPGANATVTAGFAPSGASADLNLYTGSDPNSLVSQGGGPARITPTATASPSATPSPTATPTNGLAGATSTPTPTPTPANVGSDTLSRSVNLGSSQWVYFTVVNNNDGAPLAYGGTVMPVGVAPTPTATLTATPTATPTVVQPAPAVPHDARYFSETRYRIDNDAIWGYFQARGGVDAFGFPVSRTFVFLGCTTQIMQRQVAQVCSDGQPRLINLLDPEIFPYTVVNGSTFPAPDAGLKAATPMVSDANYATAILDFVRANAPDTWTGRQVNFGRTFFGSVSADQAGTSDPGILGLLDLEIWGAPISNPAADPNNPNFVYQRFQRGIMHYDAGTGVTRGILLADYLKSVLTAQNVPADLQQQARGSRFYGQYAPGAPLWLARPSDLPATDLTWAFEQG